MFEFLFYFIFFIYEMYQIIQLTGPEHLTNCIVKKNGLVGSKKRFETQNTF